jgi:DNA-binding transcriptional regulator YiaG
MSPQQVKRLRKGLGMTQQEFADSLGVPQSTVGRWEAGLNSPRGLNLKALKELAAKTKRKAKK